MNTTGKQVVFRSDRWEESRDAEERGNIAEALNIHRKIMSEEATSYALMFRAGWLYYRLGFHEIALRYYGLACSASKGGWPRCGSSSYLSTQSGMDTLASKAKSIYDAESRTAHSVAA